MSKKFDVSEIRLGQICGVMKQWAKDTLSIKFSSKKIPKNTSVESYGGEGVRVELKSAGKSSDENPIPELWFSIQSGRDDNGDMPDAYIVHSICIWAAPWDREQKCWSLDGDYAFITFDSKTDKVVDVDFDNEHLLDDEKDSSENLRIGVGKLPALAVG